MAEPIARYVLSDHARWEMIRRGISEEVLRQVLAAPEQRLPVQPGREVLQSRIRFEGSFYLVRAFVDTDRDPAEVVTVYRTSKIEKYRRKAP
jgi:hypothetical protein